MPVERRGRPRLAHWFDGSWRGASGGNTRCRVSDVSASGCFVHGLALPQPGEQTIVTINFTASYTMTIASEVVYIERAIGFSVKFVEMDAVDETQLRDFLESFRQASA